MKTSKKEIKEFLKESNAIEGVHDDDSLKQAMYAWEYLSKQNMLTRGVILKTHKILMRNHNLRPDQRGYFRRQPVWVAGVEAIPFTEIEGKLDQLLLNIDDVVMNAQKETELFKERICKNHHILYEGIHPFVDGNGRTGRMFMNWERLMIGLPLLIIHADTQEQWDYYKWFK